MTATISPSPPRAIAIIPARIGSSRIPRKNIREFAGKPIIQYPILAAKESGLFDRIAVSSDSDAVGGIASKAGALYFPRDPKLGTSKKDMYDVIQESLMECEHRGDIYDYVCMIYACSPFLTKARLIEGYGYLLDGYQFVFPMYKTAHLERSLYNDRGSMRPRFPYEFNMNSNYWPDNFQPAEGWWWASVSALEAYRGFWGDRNKGVLVPKDEVQVIDTEEDWIEAEARYRA